MRENSHHVHIDSRRFIGSVKNSTNESPITISLAATMVLTSFSVPLESINWASIRRIIERLYTLLCGHASFYDIQTILVRHSLWNENVQSYLVKTISEFVSCKSSSKPPPNGLVSFLNRNLNEVVCIDQFFLDTVTILHIMDVSPRLSTGVLVRSV